MNKQKEVCELRHSETRNLLYKNVQYHNEIFAY
jgi:hypothetical protein